MMAVMAATATPVSSATLVVTLQAPFSINVGNYNPTNYTSPTVTLRFVNGVDYTGVAATGIPLFGQAQFVDATWTGLENMAFVSAVDTFPNPPLTQGIVDAAHVSMGAYYNCCGVQENIGIFSAVTGAFAVGSGIYWLPAVGIPTISMYSDLPGRFSVRGNWDDDAFSDAFPWRFSLSGMQWDAAATSFAVPALPPSPVPLPAGLPLLMAGLAALGLIRRRVKLPS